jgi:hypothetical protein
MIIIIIIFWLDWVILFCLFLLNILFVNYPIFNYPLSLVIFFIS